MVAVVGIVCATFRTWLLLYSLFVQFLLLCTVGHVYHNIFAFIFRGSLSSFQICSSQTGVSKLHLPCRSLLST